MRNRIVFGLVTLFLALCLASVAQTPDRTFTDVLTPQSAAAGALTLYKSQVEGYLISDERAIQQLQAATAGVPQDEADIAALKAKIVDLQNQINGVKPPAPVSQYMLAFSLSADHSAAQALDGQTVRGNLFIFTAPTGNHANFNPSGIGMVNYTLDGNMWPNVERVTPYDFNGGLPWNSASAPNGQHVVRQIVTMQSGAVEVDSATFTVAN